jgi:aldose sugar dehydrogenase
MKNSQFSRMALAGTALALVSMPAHAQTDEVVETEAVNIQVTSVVDGLQSPWALEPMPDGRWLVTEKPGQLRIIDADGSLSEPITGTPEVDARGQGGLLDVALDPDFAENRTLFLTFAEAGEGGENGTAVYRAVLSEDETSLTDGQVIFQQQPKVASTAHYGSRLVFDGEGHLFVTLGERSDAQFRTQAQDLDSHLGKIIRINLDGSVPDDNPFVDQDGALPEIWSYGHRNPQGAAINPATGVLWDNEHGPRGGDEINIIEPGANYGWPLVSHGDEYSGAPINEDQETMEGVVDPIHHWVPTSMAPSGMLFYEGDGISEWNGDLFIGALAQTYLSRLTVEGDTVTGEERLLEDLGYRIRDVAQGDDRMIYVVTDDDSNGQVLRIAPAD